MTKDYYEILGLSRDCTKEDVEKAYRKLALKYHPDRNPDDPKSAEKFREVTEAYEVLSDDSKRQRYDQYGFAGDEDEIPYQEFHHINLDDALRMFMNSFGDSFGGGPFSSFFGGDPFGERRGGRRGPMQGDSRSMTLRVSLEEAFNGAEKELEFYHLVQCPKCEGTGSKDGEPPIECPECGGAGAIRSTKRLGPVQYVTTNPCPRCGGDGVVVTEKCTKCHGKGKVREKAKKSVNIPPGVSTGNRLRLAGMGDSGERGGPPGDLFLMIEVMDHPFFERSGDDVKCNIKVTYPQAVLGSKVKVATLHGPVDLKIPSGTSSHTILRLRGKGMPNIRNPRRHGDQYVKVKIEVPKRPGIKEKKIIKKLKEIQGEREDFS